MSTTVQTAPKTQAVTKPAAQSPSKRKAAPAKPKAPAAAKAQPVSANYWVQAISVTNKKSADRAREVLDQNRISSEVFTYDDKGTTFYRVRVGPYTTKSEAEYWRTRIMQIPEFKDSKSYVTNTSAPKKN